MQLLRCSTAAVAEKLQSRSPDGMGAWIGKPPKAITDAPAEKKPGCGCGGKCGGDVVAIAGVQLTPAMLLAIGVVAGALVVLALK